MSKKSIAQSILITRPLNESRDLARVLENKGLKPILEPIFTTDFFPVKINFINAQAVILTSANAALAIIESKIPIDTKIFAVGRKSARKLIENGYKNIIYPKKISARSLYEKILQTLDPKMGDLFYFCGDSLTLDFKYALEPHRFKVHKIQSYKINWHGSFSKEFLQKTKEKAPDFIIFYSNNSARNFHRLAKNHNLLEYFATSTLLSLSEKIAQELRNLGFKNKIQLFTNNLTWLN